MHHTTNMIKSRIFALCFAALGVFASHADTIRVERAKLYGPFELLRTYETDSVNMKGEKLNARKDFTSANGISMICQRPSKLYVEHGDALAGAPNGSVRVLTFSITSQRFGKISLSAKKMKDLKIFVNGKEQGSSMQLEPGTTDVALLCISDTISKDTFNVSVITKDSLGVSVSADGKRPYGLKELNEGKHSSSLRLSPSGKYLLTVYYDTKSDGTNVFTTALTETESGKVLQRWNEHKDFKWMNDTDELYFTRPGMLGQQLIVWNPITQEETVLTETLPSGGLTIAPTRDYAIISRSQNGSHGKDPFKRLINPDDRQSSWRNRSALYHYDFNTGLLQRLTFGETSVWLSDISADGQKLLLSFSRMEPSKLPFSRTTLLEMDVKTRAVDTLLADAEFISGAVYSPDASQLLVKASPNAFDNIGSELQKDQPANGFDYRLYLYDIKSKNVEPLLMGFKPSVGGFSWQKSDGYVYFSADANCDKNIYRLEPVTKKVMAYDLPVTYVTAYSIAKTKNPRIVFSGQTGVTARDIFTCELTKQAQPKSKRIGEIDFAAMSANWMMPECRDWSFKSSRGDTIQGYCYMPLNFSPEKKYPLIVYYYGGCTPSPKYLEFQYPLAVLAAQGYVVYVVQPSGAIGFGQEFAARHVNTWGNESADDIIEGTKAFVKAHPFVDEKKIGCCGASYGGFMTQYLQTRTDIFAAAISHAGISNIASYWGGGYWGYTYGMVAQYGSYPWNNPKLYQEQSPLFNADKINTPLLLLHGTVDTNVPTNESQQMFTALRILDKPVSYVAIDGEDHVVTNFGKRVRWQKIIFAWFAHWLKDEPEWWESLFPGDKFK